MAAKKPQPYDAMIRRFLARKEHDKTEREDLFQEVYLRFEAQGGSAGVKHPKAFLLTVARNLLKDRARRQISRRASDHVALETVEIQSPAASPEERVVQSQRLGAIEDALAELPPPCRRALLLHRFQGLSYREISEDLGVSVSMVQKHISRAILHLQERLAEHDTADRRE